MATLKVSSHLLKNSHRGFLSWFEDGCLKQKEVGSFMSVGRDSKQILTLDDSYISRHHIRIEKKEEKGFLLRDMRSQNGTFLNGNKVEQAWLQNNDHILIGKTEFVFSFKKLDYCDVLNTSLNKNWNHQLSQIPSMAQSSFPVLILGETGSGKEHLAQWIHTHSRRSEGPYVSVNCSAVSETLLESEFFGHKKGSFTGADRDRKGVFLVANKGTLFLDEIGDLPVHLQPKLLKAIEYQEIKPVGSDLAIKVDVRIVAATHHDLKKRVFDKTFREDLYYRLNVLTLKPPALKDRMEDFENILKWISTQIGVSFSDKAIKKLKNHSWPGNIRELKNVVSRAQALFAKKEVQEQDLKSILEPYYNTRDILTFKTPLPPLKQLEKEMLIQVLEENNGNQKKTSDQLRIPRTTLGEKLKQYGIRSHFVSKTL